MARRTRTFQTLVGNRLHSIRAAPSFLLYTAGLVTTIKFGTDGWRGVIAEDYTYENVRRVAHAIARYVIRGASPEHGILVGYDTRFGSEHFARAAAEAVSATGTP